MPKITLTILSGTEDVFASLYPATPAEPGYIETGIDSDGGGEGYVSWSDVPAGSYVIALTSAYNSEYAGMFYPDSPTSEGAEVIVVEDEDIVLETTMVLASSFISGTLKEIPEAADMCVCYALDKDRLFVMNMGMTMVDLEPPSPDPSVEVGDSFRLGGLRSGTEYRVYFFYGFMGGEAPDFLSVFWYDGIPVDIEGYYEGQVSGYDLATILPGHTEGLDVYPNGTPAPVESNIVCYLYTEPPACSYSAQTRREIVVYHCSYSAQTRRTVGSDSSYSAQVRRAVEDDANYSAQARRTVKDICIYSAQTRRVIPELKGLMIQSAKSVFIKLGDDAGVEKFVIQDSTGQEIFSVDSNGVVNMMN